jgi:hypothetical protein
LRLDQNQFALAPLSHFVQDSGMTTKKSCKEEAMEIFECDAIRGLPQGFLEIPGKVFAQDDHWIPEDQESVQKRFCEQNSWFEKGQGLALCVPEQARLVVFVHPLQKIDDQPVAYFGFFDCLEKKRASRKVVWASRTMGP